MEWHGITAAQFDNFAREYGTPFYLYDGDLVCRLIGEVRAALGKQANVYYAVKANPNLELLRAVADTADGVDISSGGELGQAMLAGFDPSRMSFAGPAKSVVELESAIDTGVGCISVESRRELDACVQIARRLGRRAQVVLRVNPVLLNRSFGLKMGGRSVQFGIDEEAVPEIEAIVRSHEEQLDFRGIHIYAGSQCFDPRGIAEGVENTIRIAREIERRSGLRCRKINFGGGFGVSQAGEMRELEIGALTARVAPLLRAHRELASDDCEFIFELGRYLTAEAGIYVTRIVDAKVSRGKRFFTCDGGLHHHLSAAGTFGAALRGNYPIWNLSDPLATPTACSIAGPSCNPTDLLGVDVALPAPKEGDLLGVLRSGSYGFTASPLLFLGRTTPAELVRRKGEVVLARRAFDMKDFN